MSIKSVINKLRRGKKITLPATFNPAKFQPPPICPKCRTAMILRQPRNEEQNWNPFYGCSRYPACNGTRNINTVTGEIETDEQIREKVRFIRLTEWLLWSEEDFDDWHPGHPSNYGDQ